MNKSQTCSLSRVADAAAKVLKSVVSWQSETFSNYEKYVMQQDLSVVDPILEFVFLFGGKK